MPETILRPVHTWFVYLTLLIAFMTSLLPWGSWAITPDWIALTILFWSIREPRLVGFGVAFILGLLMDTRNGMVLGEHALVYVMLSFIGITLSKRLPSFDAFYQTMHIIPILLSARFLSLIIRSVLNGSAPDLTALISPLLAALLWPVLLWLFLVPQRTPINVDLNRPL
jgi:rod shape-determining protein MreD